MKLLKFIFAVFSINCCFINLSFAVSWSDVSINLTVDEESIVGEPVSINIKLENSARLAPYVKVATNPVVTVILPPDSSDIVSAECVPTDQSTLQCALPEIAVGEIVQITISAVLNNAGHTEIAATVDADDLLGGAVSDTQLLTVLTQSVNSDAIDLEIVTPSNGRREVKIEGSEGVYVAVRNAHENNTAFYPSVVLTMGEELGFISGDNCSEINRVVTCKLPMLAPQAETDLFVTLTGNTLSENIPFTIAAVSTQPETEPGNNTAELSFSVINWTVLCGASNPSCSGGTDTPATPETDLANATDNVPDTSVEQVDQTTTEPDIAPAQEAVSSSISGGGGMSAQLLFLLLLLSLGNIGRTGRFRFVTCTF